MLYVLLFTVLSIGFFAASTMSVQIARNDQAAAEAQAAAESGMQFCRYQLGKIDVPGAAVDHQLLRNLADALTPSLNGTPNMRGRSVAITGDVIFLPSPDHFIPLDSSTGARFQAQIATRGKEVWVKTIGCGTNAKIARAIQMRFERDPQTSSRLRAVADSYEEVTP